MDVNAEYLHIAWHVVLYCVTSMLIKIMQYKGVYSLRTDFQVLGVVKLKYTLDSILTTSSTLKSVCSTKRVHIALSCETYTLQNNTCYKFATYFFSFSIFCSKQIHAVLLKIYSQNFYFYHAVVLLCRACFVIAILFVASSTSLLTMTIISLVRKEKEKEVRWWLKRVWLTVKHCTFYHIIY